MLGPILVRELRTLPRRPRHYLARTVYLGLVWILALTAWQALVGWQYNATLGDNARFSLLLFQVLTYVQLALLLFFPALSAASSITTEKDRRTFILLLMTDLTNYEIVLGKLFGSLLQMLLLLAGLLPVLTMLILLGGVDGGQVIQAMIVMAATAVFSSSLGTLMAVWREKTFQTLALTFLFLVLYLCAVHALAIIPNVFSLGDNMTMHGWLDWLEPFLALQTVLEPSVGRAQAVPAAYGFAVSMAVLSLLLDLVSIWGLRRWNPSGEPIIKRELPGAAEADEAAERRAAAHAAPGAVRRVWPNPIIWREIRTRAYGRRPLLIKLAYFLVVGLICYYNLLPILRGNLLDNWAAASVLLPVSLLSLLLITAQAVTAITSERDTGALDLLLVTDLTANEFIYGKLGGILYNSKEFVIPPIILTIIYGFYGYLATPPELGRNLEAMTFLALGLIVLLAFTMVLGVHVALRTPVSRLAIVNGLGTVFFLSIGTLICIYLILINGRFEYQWLSFVFFLAAGFVGLWWVLSGNRPSTALNLASGMLPIAVFYSVTNVLIGRPGTQESSDPIFPFLVGAGSFGFAIVAMLVPLLSEFDVAMGRTSGEAD
jgi:ABC-type transport system involved in multi-copper enzyme maturation permease subunit